MRLHHALLIVCAAAGLTACGGNDDETVTSPPVLANEVPASAVVSATAYQQFAASLKNSETALPLDLNKVGAAPTSETQAPAAL